MSENLSAVVGASHDQNQPGFRSPHEVIIRASNTDPTPADVRSVVSGPSAARVLRFGYDAKHLLPDFVLGVVLTIASVLGSVWFRPALPHWLTPLFTIALWASLAALWAFLLFRWAYRVCFWRVEVTEREVIYRRGWLWPKSAVLLAELARAEVRQNWWQRLCGFGHLALIAESPGVEATLLLAITDPQELAEILGHRIRQARAADVQQTRLPLGGTHGIASLAT